MLSALVPGVGAGGNVGGVWYGNRYRGARCDLIGHMRENGSPTVEPAAEAEDAWMEQVFALADLTLVSRASTWCTGTNADAKPRYPTLHIGRERAAVE